MKQIIVIHGGNSFKTYEEYLEYLKAKDLSLKKLKPRNDWKDNLQKSLGDSFEVLLPRMPDSNNAKYIEWQIWFEKILDITNNDIILVGHSLGGMFLIKYLSENSLNKKIRGLFIVSALYKKEATNNEYTRFAHIENLKNISAQCKDIYFFHSKDDDVVNFEDLEGFKKELPEAEFIVLEDRGHFNSEDFPELVERLRNG